MNQERNQLSASTDFSPVNIGGSDWLTKIDNEFQALVGFGACVAQGVIGLAQMFGQSEIMCAKIDAEASLAKTKADNEGKLQSARIAKEAQVVSSSISLLQEEVKRLGSRIDRMSALILEKYSSGEMTQFQINERANLEKIVERDQHQLDELLRHVMEQTKS